MKSALIYLILIWSLGLPAIALATDDAESIIFENARLVDPASGQASEPTSIGISQGRIVALETLSENATRVAANGRYLMPGLAEMHAHVPPERAGTQHVHDTLLLYLAHGITTIRGMLGEPSHLVLRQQLADGDIVGPRLITSGPSFNNRTIASPAAAVERVRAQHEAGYDLLKLHPGLWPDAFDAIRQTADLLDMDYSGHISIAVGLDRVLDSNQGSIDHLDGYGQSLVPESHPLYGTDPGLFAIKLVDGMDEERIPALAERTAAAGIANVPTQSLIENWATGDIEALMTRPAMRWVSAETQTRWRTALAQIREGTTPAQRQRYVDLRRTLIRGLYEADALLLLGADAPQILNVPGDAIHHELEIYVASGLSPADALATGTTNVARYLDQEGLYGCLKPGCVADLVLLNANPLDQISNTRDIAGVMRAGRWFDRAMLDQMLEGVAERAAGKS
ncbi:MAG: amidohydrolase family protein [Wenzhouxiangella sp.]|nr:amidohydrolase family protein [Wenzhouxiangella sp.]